MAMAHQAEFETTLTRSENTAPEPTTLDTSEIIIPGYNSYREQQAARSIVELEKSPETALIDSMFDEYVSVLSNPQDEYRFKTQNETAKEFNLNAQGEIIDVKEPEPIFITMSKKEVLDAKYKDLLLYTKGSVLSEDFDLENSSLSVEEWALREQELQTLLKMEVDGSIQRAIERAGYSTHISFESEDEDPESASKFIEALKGMKDLGAVAIQSIQSAVPTFSAPIDLVRRIREAAPGRPANPKDLTGDSLTVTMKTVKK